MSWSKRRKFLYTATAFIVVFGAIIIPAFVHFYHAPTCFDGFQNGGETGVDCGGGCSRLCQSAFYSPQVAWTRFEEVAPGLYNIAAYIINQNTQAEAVAPYHVIMYDNGGIPISEYTGTVTLPPHRNTLAFKAAVDLGKRAPEKALFQFSAPPDWHSKNDSLSAIQVTDKHYTEQNGGSSLTVSLKNAGVQPIGRFSVYVVLYDKDSNAIGFSRTVVDGIGSKGSTVAPFTWPVDRKGSVISIEVLPVEE